MIYRLLLLSILSLIYNAAASAEVLTAGQPISDAINAMKVAGYRGTILAMGPGAVYTYPEHDLHSWEVDEGFLNIIYSKTTNKIVRLSFLCQDERAKGERKSFVFEVSAFDTDTGELRIRTRKDKPVPRPDPPESKDNPFKDCAPSKL